MDTSYAVIIAILASLFGVCMFAYAWAKFFKKNVHHEANERRARAGQTPMTDSENQIGKRKRKPSFFGAFNVFTGNLEKQRKVFAEAKIAAENRNAELQAEMNTQVNGRPKRGASKTVGETPKEAPGAESGQATAATSGDKGKEASKEGTAKGNTGKSTANQVNGNPKSGQTGNLKAADTTMTNAVNSNPRSPPSSQSRSSQGNN